MFEMIQELHEYAKITGTSFTLEFSQERVTVRNINGKGRDFKVVEDMEETKTYKEIASFIFEKES